MKSGGTYVPLDSNYSSQRLTCILEDAEPLCLLADATGQKALGDHQVPMVDLNHAFSNGFSTANPDPNKLGLNTKHMAYLIYTSGSTGTPKGVMIEHQAIINLVYGVSQLIDVDSNTRILQFASCCFDASIWEIVMSITTGACLCMPNEEVRKLDTALLNYINAERITHALLPPALFRNTQNLTHLTGLKTLLLGGEAPSLSLLQTVSTHTPVFNCYGPTETTIVATTWLCPENFSSASIPIGRPCSNTKIYLLDAQGEPVPLGAEGEVYVGGAGVARGYLNRSDLTAERFLPDPFSNKGGARMYRT
ncbi:uncharacterized protein LOC116344936, partial [Contarinia nasturtii]|uniref:uncharacterized protein LOC116344936 n=1 Tax=Contarinia nasturtii TaxID=265458 RepID=UPI0012D4139D